MNQNTQNNKVKPKVSAFEYAIMSIADPEGARKCEPFTRDEEIQQRRDKIENQLRQLRGKDGQPVALLYPHPLSER